MELQHKPRLGILALMLEGYEPLFPGIMASQHKYVEEVIASLSGTADFVFPRIAASREAIEALTAQYNAEGLDGILILMLSYSQGQYLVHAMQRNTLPLALALVQPDETVGDDFEEWELTVNQGIHGSQDNANCLMRAGIPCAFFAGSRKNGELAAFAADFGAAAHTACALRRMKIGIIGKLAGMGDVITDDMAVYRKLGPEFVYDSIGAVQRACAGVTPEDISARVAYEHTVFEIDPKLPPECHAESVRMYLGLKRYLEENGYAGYTVHFEEFGADGRFEHLPFLAASSLMADGYGYDIQCEVVCENGTVKLPDPYAVVRRSRPAGWDSVQPAESMPIMTDWKERFIEAYDIEFCKWVESVHAGKLTGPSSWDGYVACVAGDALNASRGTSQFMKVETMEKPEMYK